MKRFDTNFFSLINDSKPFQSDSSSPVVNFQSWDHEIDVASITMKHFSSFLICIVFDSLLPHSKAKKTHNRKRTAFHVNSSLTKEKFNWICTAYSQ